MLVKETARERAENDAPILVPVHELSLPQGRICRLYVGNLTGASDGAALLAAGITASLNVSLNIDVAPLQLPDGTHMRRAKVGLIDGAGNAPAHRAGNVLVNCRGGRSRSVVVLAIYLHLRAPGAFPTLGSAVSHIREARGNSRTYPLPPMLDLAHAVLASGGLAALLRG